MQSRSTQRYTLELDADQEPIAGSLTDQAGTNTPFSGWLSLARLLERARTHAGARNARNCVLARHEPAGTVGAESKDRTERGT